MALPGTARHCQQALQAGTTSRRCKAVRAVGMECSPHRLQVRGASPQPIPGGQGAEGCGTGQDGTSAGGACGQVVTMKRSLLAHSPAAAHASQAESPLLHAADSHWKQDLLYVGNKLAQAAAPGGTPKAGFGARSGLRLLQAPGQASPPGPLWPAMQSSSRLDMEQDSRHAVRMKPGFELHSPSAAQVRQLSLVSMHSSDGEAPPDASTCARTTSCA